MNQHPSRQSLELLGYYTLPRPHADSPGYSGLLAVLRQEPERHEPETIHLTLQEKDGRIDQTSLHAGAYQPGARVVCPGYIVIRSRQEREATFYTFGGAFEGESLPGELVFSLRSAAPVLGLQPDRETIADQLAAEAEALFARVEAKLKFSSDELLNRLVGAGPEAVYLSVLQSLLPHEEGSAVFHQYRTELIHMLRHERNWYQQAGQWPNIPYDLDMLLQTVDIN